MKSSFIVSIMVLALAGSVRMQALESQNGLLQGGPAGMISNALSSITGTLSRAFSGVTQQQPQPQQQPSMLGGGLNQLLSRQGSQLRSGQMDQQLMQTLSSSLDQAAREIQQIQQQIANNQLIPNMRQQGMNNPISTLLRDLTTLLSNLVQMGGARVPPMNNNFSEMLQGLQQQLPLGGRQGLSRTPSSDELPMLISPSPTPLGEAAQNFLGNMPGGFGNSMQPQQGGSPMNPSNFLQQGLNRLPSGLSRSNSLDNMMSQPQMQQKQQQTPQQQAPMNGPPASSQAMGGGSGR